MKRLTIVVVVLALIYSGYWFAGARALEQTATIQLSDLQDAGWQVDYADLSVRGFPSRFDTSLTDLTVTAPAGDVGYAAPFVQALALAYQPNRVIMALPETQSVTFGGQDIAIASTGLRASVGVNANTALSLSDATAEATHIAVTSPDLGQIAFSGFLAAIREAGDLPNSYATYLNAQTITLPTPIMGLLQGADLPDTLEVIKADATIVLDRALNRHTLPVWEDDPGRLRGLTLRDLTIRWGDLAITADGEITIDETGTPEGTLTFKATEWERMLTIALDAGLVPENVQFMAASVGRNLSGGAKDLELPIRFQNGNWAAGPFPLGLAPKF